MRWGSEFSWRLDEAHPDATASEHQLRYYLVFQEPSFRGSNAAATRRPSSASRLYVEQAFHYNNSQYTSAPCC